MIKRIRLNNVQYNPNRDPQFYRRTVGEEFRLQVFLDGGGRAQARLEAEGATLCEAEVALPGAFDCRFRFDRPGTRVGTVTVVRDGDTVRQDIRLDVEAHAWVG